MPEDAYILPETTVHMRARHFIFFITHSPTSDATRVLKL